MTSGALIHSGLEEAPEQREKGGDEAYMALEEWVGLLVGRERELGLSTRVASTGFVFLVFSLFVSFLCPCVF